MTAEVKTELTQYTEDTEEILTFNLHRDGFSGAWLQGLGVWGAGCEVNSWGVFLGKSRPLLGNSEPKTKDASPYQTTDPEPNGSGNLKPSTENLKP